MGADAFVRPAQSSVSKTSTPSHRTETIAIPARPRIQSFFLLTFDLVFARGPFEAHQSHLSRILRSSHQRTSRSDRTWQQDFRRVGRRHSSEPRKEPAL